MTRGGEGGRDAGKEEDTMILILREGECNNICATILCARIFINDPLYDATLYGRQIHLSTNIILTSIDG